MTTKEIIIKSLCITDDEYANMVERSGYAWLSRLMDDRLINEVAKIELFWKWWKNQWEIRDREFVRMTNLVQINEALGGKTQLYAGSLYNDIHNPYNLIIIPNTWVHQEILKVLNNEIQKEEKFINQKKREVLK